MTRLYTKETESSSAPHVLVRRDTLVLALLLAFAAAYLLPFVDRTWVPFDVGLHGQSAERVLQGELPHRDFIDMYTGGLAFLHAAVFSLTGPNALALRWLLYVSTLLATPILYLLARRATGPLVAAAVSALGLAWSVPLYFESMPSWYNLFLAAGACEALLRARRDRRIWLFVAGLCAGTSIAIKSIGTLVVATALLYFVYLDQDERTDDLRGSSGSWFVSVGLLTFLAVLLAVPAQWPTARNFLHFGLPGALIVALLLRREWSGPSGTMAGRLRSLLRPTVPFVTGCLVPLVALVLPYLLQGAASSILQGRVFLPTERLDRAYYALPSPMTLVAVLPFCAIFLLSSRADLAARWDRRLGLPALLAGIALVALGKDPRVYQLVWFGLRPLVPLTVAFGAWQLQKRSLDPRTSRSLFLVLTATALCSLVQFPQSMGIYFGYTAPLVALSYLHAASAQPGSPRRIHGVVFLVLACYAVLWIGPSRQLDHGIQTRPLENLQPLELDKASLRVSPSDARTYQALVGSIRALVPPGKCIWAGPGAPEIYFLADRCNPTPTFTEIFDPEYGTPEHGSSLLRLIDDEEIEVAVLNRAPAFSDIPAGLPEGLTARFENHVEIRQFVLFWGRRSPSSS